MTTWNALWNFDFKVSPLLVWITLALFWFASKSYCQLVPGPWRIQFLYMDVSGVMVPQTSCLRYVAAKQKPSVRKIQQLARAHLARRHSPQRASCSLGHNSQLLMRSHRANSYPDSHRNAPPQCRMDRREDAPYGRPSGEYSWWRSGDYQNCWSNRCELTLE